MSFSYCWTHSSRSRGCILARQAAVLYYLSGFAVVTAAVANHPPPPWKSPPTSLMEPPSLSSLSSSSSSSVANNIDDTATSATATTADTDTNTNSNKKKSLYSDVRPAVHARKRWTWSALFWGLLPGSRSFLDWRTEYQTLARQLLQNDNYQAMPDPATVMIDSHAITGALLKEHYIEAYRVFSKKTTTSMEGDDDNNHKDKLDNNNNNNNSNTNDPQVVALVRVGTRVDGHQGIVHGGIVAMLVDDVLGYGFYSMGWPAAFTANLNVNYRRPIPAATILRIECYFDRQEGRKLYWNVRVVDARKPSSILYVDASSLFVIPKQIYQQVLKKRQDKR